MSMAALPSFDEPDEVAPIGCRLRPLVLKSAVLRDRERDRVQENQAFRERQERLQLAEQELAAQRAEQDRASRSDEQAESVRRTVLAIGELVTRTAAARDAAVGAAARDTVEAAAALAAWFLRAGPDAADDPRDAAGARTLATRIEDALERMLPTSTPVIVVAPQSIEALGALLAEHGGIEMELRADRSLMPGEARIDAGDAHADLTIGGALQRAVDGIVRGARKGAS
jgi:flagellar biosynthesis/type III secretory pathway protein FliH